MNTISNFGDPHGRLGNQLFQLAVLFAIRERRGHDFFLPREDAALWDCFDLDVARGGEPCSHRFLETPGASIVYRPDVFDQPDGTAFEGYFQSFRYLEDCRERLLPFLRFHARHRAFGEALAFSFRRTHRRPLVALHVRRGDYVDSGEAQLWGELASGGYYERAIDAIGSEVLYVVLSDDIEWCRGRFQLDCAVYPDIDGPTSLSLMTIADAVVIANSTFSWWGAYLNPTADVYAPDRWFGPEMPPPNDRPDDILCPGWRRLATS